MAETKNEYVDGMLVARSGARENHVLITTNITGELYGQLKGRSCRIYATDMRVRIAEGNMCAYPDIAVICEPPEFQDNEFDVLLNPRIIIEVLSESTEAYDRGLKFALYRQRISLQEYVLVAQDRTSIERFSRQGGQWVLTEATGLDATTDRCISY